MVTILQKDLFLTKSGLSRIDQLLGMKCKDNLCLVQAEDDVVLFEIWNIIEEKIILQRKVHLYNYQLSSNVITLETNQLAFYAVMEETGVQCLFLVDIFNKSNNHIQSIPLQCTNQIINNQIVMNLMIEEQQLNSSQFNQNKSSTDNNDLDPLYRNKDTATSLNKDNIQNNNQTFKNKQKDQNELQTNNEKNNDFVVEGLNNEQDNIFKLKSYKINPPQFEADILDVGSDGSVGLKEDIIDLQRKKSGINVQLLEKQKKQQQNNQPNNISNDDLQQQQQQYLQQHQLMLQRQKQQDDEDGTMNSLPLSEDKNLPLFLEQQTEEISYMNSFMTQDNIQLGQSGMNDIQNILDDINCINNYENYTNTNQIYLSNNNNNNNINNNINVNSNNININNINSKLQNDFTKVNEMQRKYNREDNHLSLQDNNSLSNSNIQNHEQLKQFANYYNHSPNSSQNNISNHSNIDNNNNNKNKNKRKIRQYGKKKQFFGKEILIQNNNKNDYNNNGSNQSDNGSNSYNNSMNNSSSEQQSQQQNQIFEQSYKYLQDKDNNNTNNNMIKCIYDVNQKELFSSCVEFYSEILGQGYHGIIIVKNTYYMVNYDDSYYMLLVLSIYRSNNSQQFAQYILHKEVNDLNNNIQVICVQNSHKIIIYDPSRDELIIWSYFGESLTPQYFTFQQFQSLYISYAFQNLQHPLTYYFIYKDHQSNLYKILTYDFLSGNNITKGFNNTELNRIRSPILVKQQEAYIIKNMNQNILIICTIYKNNELTTYWNVYELNCGKKQDNEQECQQFQQQTILQTISKTQQKRSSIQMQKQYQLQQQDQILQGNIFTHLDSSETDNNDIKTHFVPNFSLVSPNIYFFNTSDIHSDVQSAINTFIHNKDIHFKAFQVLF